MSSDINRLQQFQNQDLAEFMRQMLNVGTSDSDPGLVSEAVTLGTPLLAEIVNGGMVRPVAGSFALTVDPVVLYALAPDGAADDSNYKYVRDPGIPSAGVLAIGPNASGSIRIDVIECSVDPTDATVSDSRDIFNPATDLFAATSVTKELKGRLIFRVRAGTGGSGYPAAASGWMPLCVASVPSGAASNNAVTFWDVRPLLADRAGGPMNNALGNKLVSLDDECSNVDATHVNIIGETRAILGGRRVGGAFRNCVPGTSVDLFNVYDVLNQDSGTIASGSITGNVHVYLATPFGLPRWSRYTDGPTGRVPREPKGLLIASETVPVYAGTPSSAIALPASTGLGGTTSIAICVEVVRWGNGNGNVLLSHRTGNKTQLSVNTFVMSGAYNVILPDSIDYHLRDQDWPPNARAAWIRLGATVNIPATTQVGNGNTLIAYSNNTGAGPDALVLVNGVVVALTNIAGGAVNRDVRSGLMRVPLPPMAPPGTGTPSSPRLIQWQLAPALTVSNTSLEILGFEF